MLRCEKLIAACRQGASGAVSPGRPSRNRGRWRRWEDWEVQLMRQLAGEGMSNNGIAFRLGRSPSGVERKRRRA